MTHCTAKFAGFGGSYSTEFCLKHNDLAMSLTYYGDSHVNGFKLVLIFG